MIFLSALEPPIASIDKGEKHSVNYIFFFSLVNIHQDLSKIFFTWSHIVPNLILSFSSHESFLFQSQNFINLWKHLDRPTVLERWCLSCLQKYSYF